MLQPSRMLVAALFAAGILVTSGPSLAAEASLSGAGVSPVKTVQEQCVRLVKKLVGRETLVNTCPVCQMVKVERARGGGALPTFRTVVVQPLNTFDLPFKGPGNTRIVGVDACKG